MPEFFLFTQGTDSAARYQPDSTPLLGRFRAVPPPQVEPPFRRAQLGLLASGRHPGSRRSNHCSSSNTNQSSANSNHHHTHTRSHSYYSIGRSASHARSMHDNLERGGSVHAGYGAIMIPDLEASDNSTSDSSDDSDADGEDNTGLSAMRSGPARRIVAWASSRLSRAVRRTRRKVVNLYIQPRQGTVKRAVNMWYGRYFVLVLLPALLAIVWCAIPIPQYDLPEADDSRHTDSAEKADPKSLRLRPVHGAARVQANFWFFLCVFYGLYNLVALMWITKAFNIYNLNWWPQRLGFPLTLCLIAVIGTAAPILIYYRPETEFLTRHNTWWISWTFVIMAMPVMIAFMILTVNERHLGLRKSLSETQRIFTSSWWTGDQDTGGSFRVLASSGSSGRGHILHTDFFDDPSLKVAGNNRKHGRRRGLGSGDSVAIRRSWLPASFVRFIWFCMALTVGLSAYLIGEAYAEIYLRTLPHGSWETVIYVYSWVITVHLLDMLTGWILGVREGERVGSYPLSWIFKLYYMITYQTYVRALYARLRSPTQFLWLQLLSSSSVIILVPVTMAQSFYQLLVALGLSTQSYAGYQKLCLRNVFIRFIAENASMVTFIGSVAVLHFGSNKDLYPYFAFDQADEPYTFQLTYISSLVTWACELAAAGIVRLLIRYFYGIDVDLEGKMDLVVWPELIPTSAAVTLHVLQNMMFSIIRLQFKRR
ncbi:hypothetical protein CFIMG_006908RA [Ceratocystis fimbriata CBS 114723]|uniref:Uncharacterized protein n=1 Tax=Ceratocystis fimbriata CBS 114723 TaxID=1035309 RepID=A0A2C5WSH9_9PEZI|nr:hypothetical protein CFIMG_006908RA [Ceratocystis fimbriata CBS 114723]